MKIKISDETVYISENTCVYNIHSLLKFWGGTKREQEIKNGKLFTKGKHVQRNVAKEQI